MTNMVNHHRSHPTSLRALISSLIRNRQLIYYMTRREVYGRYKGSIFGVGWSFFTPILMLIIYTFVFSVVFKSRWGVSESENKFQFALILFVGIIIFNLFSETINRAPSLILTNVNYVKKVVFPLEILPVICIGQALLHLSISSIVLLLGFFLLNGFIFWTVLLLPIVILPLIFLILGTSLFLASLGVFIRDVGQVVGIFTALMLFISPIFYPVTAIPENYRPVIFLNPISFIIEQARNVLIFGVWPNWFGLFIYMICAVILMQIGFMCFQRTRGGFSDVL